MYTPPPNMGGPTGTMRDRLRPMGIGDILDETFRLYRANFVLFVATVAVLEVPLQILSTLFSVSLVGVTSQLQSLQNRPPGEPLTPAEQQQLLHASLLSGGFGLLLAIVAIVVSALISAAMAVVISQRYLDRPITVGEAYRAGLKRLGALVLGLIWISIRAILMIITIVGIPFAIYFLVSWSLFPQAVMLEGAGAGSGSGRSRELIKGYWWKALGLLIVTGLIVAILGGIARAVIGGVAGAVLGNSTMALYIRTIITGIVGLIVGVLLEPIQSAPTTLLFYDLKIRKEAFDLEALAQQAMAPLPS